MSDRIRILQINSSNFGSTGGIVLNIAEKAKDRGYLPWQQLNRPATNIFVLSKIESKDRNET